MEFWLLKRELLFLLNKFIDLNLVELGILNGCIWEFWFCKRELVLIVCLLWGLILILFGKDD